MHQKSDLEPRETTLSVVVPMFNEAENVPHFCNRLIAVLEKLGCTYEVLLVDDGSSDGTWAAIKNASMIDPAIKGVRLARNFGHQGALLAGLSTACGRGVISMDGDLQHPPELLPKMVDAWRAGAPVVSTCRTYNSRTSSFKKLTSALYYRIFSYMSEVDMKAGHSDFRLLDRTALDQLLAFQQNDAFLRGIVSWLDFPTVTIEFTADDRLYGESKFTLNRMIRFARNGVLAFSTKPLRIGIALGLATSCLSFLYLVYILVQYSRGATVEGWASTLGLLSLLFGILFVMLGIIGTYLGRIYLALQRRPSYVIFERSGIDLHK